MYISLKVRTKFVQGQSYQYVTLRYNKLQSFYHYFVIEDERSMIRGHKNVSSYSFNVKKLARFKHIRYIFD